MNRSATPSIRDSQRIAFIHSSWHQDVVERARDAFIDEAARLGIASKDIDLFEVPGAFEIPLHAKLLAQSGAYAGIVACGLVVDGGIYRHDFVAATVIDGLMRVQLDTCIPVFSVVLTPHHFHEHEQHRRFFLDHFIIKGREAAQACVQTLRSLERLAAPAQAGSSAVSAARVARSG